MTAPPVSAPAHQPTVPLLPVAAPKKQVRRGILAAGAGAVALAAVAAGALVITRDASEAVIVQDSTQLAADPAATPGYSFAAATANAQTAASVVFDMEIESPDGPMTATAAFDKASGRMSMELDMSQLVEDDESFIEIGDSLAFIADESAQVAYISADFLAGFIPTDASWISLTTDEFSVDDDVFGDVFANPLDIADVFGDLEPLDLGEVTVDGELLHHFEVTIDATTIAQLDADKIDEELAADMLADDDLALLGGSVTYGVWVDEANQIRRMTFDVVDDGEVGSVELWVDISTESIDIALPSPDDVVDMDELFGSAFEADEES
ncbi:MAG: hypothetical protein AB8G14_00710 [Ilumatobacter sp.]